MKEFIVIIRKPINRYPQLDPRGYLVIEAKSWDHARKLALERLGRAWSFIYPVHEFASKKKYYPKGELARWKDIDEY